jgi:hypothetical protein
MRSNRWRHFGNRLARHFFTASPVGALFGDIPAVFASGVVGRERLFTLYRLAFVWTQGGTK